MMEADGSEDVERWRGRVGEAFAALGPHLARAAAADPALRDALRAWLEALSVPLTSMPAMGDASDEDAERSAPDLAALTSPARDEERRFFRTADPMATMPAAGVSQPVPPTVKASPVDAGVAAVTNDDLPRLARRSQLKAEGSRWAAERERLIEDGADFRDVIAPRDSDIIDRARALPDCFLWMCHPSAPTPDDIQDWEVLAGCFDTMAMAMTLVHSLLSTDDEGQSYLEQAADLLAAAQSMTRAAVESLGARPDADQDRAFHWLKRFTSERGVYISRHMRLNDPADPSDHHALATSIDELEQAWQQVQQTQRRQRSQIGKVRYHLDQLANGPTLDPGHDWRTIVNTIDEAIEDGRRPSDPTLRDLLLPALDKLPDELDLPLNFQRVMREIDRYLESRPSSDPDVARQPASPDVERLAQLLEGKTMVLIGGYRRAEAQQNLQEAFRLRELRWVVTKPHQSLDEFEPSIADPDVRVVLLAIRWSSHSFGGVKAICDRHGKCLVRLPAGYGVNRVASDVLRQCSAELEASRGERKRGA